MSSFDFGPSEPNPFASPEAASMAEQVGDDTVQPRSSIDHLEAFSFLFQNPNWIINVLLLTLLQLLPIVGPMIIMGYSAEIVGKKAIGRTPTYADFDFNRFGEYLMRGLWILLLGLLGSLPLIPVYLVFFALAILAQQAIGDEGMLLLLLMYPVMMVCLLLLGVILQPMIIRAGFQNDLGTAFDWAWIRDFIGKMWVDQLIGSFVIFLLGFLVTMVGMLFFCVGMYPAMVIGHLAWWHFLMQLYQVYIGRGGQSVRFVD